MKEIAGGLINKGDRWGKEEVNWGWPVFALTFNMAGPYRSERVVCQGLFAYLGLISLHYNQYKR